jgi:endonuclease/exonuclease/phosphatase family metal-dependent hydrolase
VRRKTKDLVVATVAVVILVGAAVVTFAFTHQEPPAPLAAFPPPAAPGDAGHTGSPAPSSPRSSATSRPTHQTTGPSAPSSTCVHYDQQARLTVVTFNIRSARAQDGSVHLDAIAAALAAWHPDLILLQEVDRGRNRTGRVDMPAVLADRLHMAWTFGENLQWSPTSQYGTAILSRYPILQARNVHLPDPPGTEQRGLLHASVDVGGLPVSVYVTHLENTSKRARLEQIRAIAPILAADPAAKILGGDLNSIPASAVLARSRTLMADTWLAAGHGPGDTVPAWAPHARIDYLLYRGGSGVTITPLRAEVLPRVVSDHRAVWASYRLSTGANRVCIPVLPALTRNSPASRAG